MCALEPAGLSPLRIFTGSAAIIVGSLSIGPQPHRSLGGGAGLLAMATDGDVAWVGRSAGEPELPAAPRWWSRHSARGSFARAAPVFMLRR